MVFCSKCGTEYKKRKKFCPKCGAEFKGRPKTKSYILIIGASLIGLVVLLSIFSNSENPTIMGFNERLSNLGVNTENLGSSFNKGALEGSRVEKAYCGDGTCGDDESCKT